MRILLFYNLPDVCNDGNRLVASKKIALDSIKDDEWAELYTRLVVRLTSILQLATRYVLKTYKTAINKLYDVADSFSQDYSFFINSNQETNISMNVSKLWIL